MSTLSVILITKNEAINIKDCLQSVSFADEIIVVDSGSMDGTIEMAKELGAKVVVTPDWPGFGPQKARALALATCDWVLSLDADERVDEALAAEIRQAISRANAEAFDIPRRSLFCGQIIKHSGWWPDYVTRLFRRGSCQFSLDLVHERLLLEPNTRHARLQHPLLHYSYRNFSQVLQKIDSYSSAGAQMRFAAGKRSGLGQAIRHGLWAFLRTYFLRRGFLDGRAGFLIALMNAEASFYRYIKLADLQRQS